MSAELHNESGEGGQKGLTPLELGSGILVTAASAYIMFAHVIPQTDAYIAENIAPEITDNLILWSRLGAALMVSAAGTGGAWVAGRLQKKE